MEDSHAFLENARVESASVTAAGEVLAALCEVKTPFQNAAVEIFACKVDTK